MKTCEVSGAELPQKYTIKVEETPDGEFVASLDDTTVSFTDDTPVDAVKQLLLEIEDAAETYEAEDSLGDTEATELARLEAFLGIED